MLRPYSLLMALFCNLAAVPAAMAAESLAEFAGQFSHAQFIDDNATALKFRLALLDHAKTGAQVRIATFTFDAGAATKALGEHMCGAIARGVKVELIVDSKSGEIAGQENPFNGTPAGKATEQAYQTLANCGVKIFIHNFTTDYVNISLLGKRIPNIFDGSVQNGASVNPFTLKSRLQQLRDRLVLALGPVLRKNGFSSDPSKVLANLQSLVLNLAQTQGIAGQPAPSGDDSGAQSPLDNSIAALSSDYRAILSDPFWAQFDRRDAAGSIRRLTAVNQEIVSILQKDPVLKPVRDRLRVFNRLNHRKLFMVTEPSGESCVIIGGRNLGDDYLTDSAKSFRDGDVFFCGNHVKGADAFFKEAAASLDQLKTDPTDPMLTGGAKVAVNLLAATRPITPARVAAVSFAGLKGLDLGEMTNPMLLRSSWNPGTDAIRMAMLEAILRERKEIYIETAYAEFNSSMREALELAMKKNHVKVHIVTNGLFISDGASQLIRPWMARWNDEMEAKYRDLFEIDYATLQAGHMIHFKGAGFRCQAGLGKTFYRQYIVGSHNFHPRSGYSDKEHAIEWREPVDASCPDPKSDLIAMRLNYYHQQRVAFGAPILRVYGTLLEELSEVSQHYEDPKNADMARAIRRTMYENDNLVLADKLEWIQELLDQSGLRDLIGVLL